MVYAASSSTYVDHPGLPKVDEVIGKPLSPYAVTKLNELYADVFARSYGIQTVGLRSFNVFGPGRSTAISAGGLLHSQADIGKVRLCADPHHRSGPRCRPPVVHRYKWW